LNLLLEPMFVGVLPRGCAREASGWLDKIRIRGNFTRQPGSPAFKWGSNR
jgi:hypothetical protein